MVQLSSSAVPLGDASVWLPYESIPPVYADCNGASSGGRDLGRERIHVRLEAIEGWWEGAPVIVVSERNGLGPRGRSWDVRERSA